jgi:3D (Asp-Asp-Asp) domain-containing protein
MKTLIIFIIFFAIIIPSVYEEPIKAEALDIAVIDVKTGVIREVTAYTAGDPYTTDDTPCISASGDNICELLAKGQLICAANFVDLGTKLYVDNYGECTVLDRLNSRYTNRVDVAMQAHEKQRALNFGLQRLYVIE